MRLWYAWQLELPDGMLLRGVTLLAIKPSEEWTTGAVDGFLVHLDGCKVSDAFEEPYRTAAKMLMNKRTYCIEMNSF
ncbi:unnamed protein product [Musa acuminata subsp. malaccensis]|uniref:(wild Malaysian banana) hypothetical protein n=1 Tax=Musa acuminata subsp. malaccensis TaxID=214687 RepID=A0A804LBL5_MUSAM|nr:unnamed protein product [Musa acuminata subsp. malaccensis]